MFFGGGTPSLFSPEAIGRVLAARRRASRRGGRCGSDAGGQSRARSSAAASPSTVPPASRASRSARRASMRRRLAVLGRIHSPDETRRAAEELHAAGLDNFNLDLMYALPRPGRRRRAARRRGGTGAGARAHLSHYQLTIEPGTVFAARPPPLPDDDAAAAMLGACAARLEAAGFGQYEVSAWARPRRAVPAQPQLLDLRGLSRRRRRCARQAHPCGARADRAHHAACASRADISRRRRLRVATVSRERASRSSSC